MQHIDEVGMSGKNQALDSVAQAMSAILARLTREWPDPIDLRPSNLLQEMSDTDFIAAAVALQDEGLIMYEALLIGACPSPELIAVLLTRKGQSAQCWL